MKIKIFKVISLIVIVLIFIFIIYFKFIKINRNIQNTVTDTYQTNCGEYKKGEVGIENKKLPVVIADDKCKIILGLSGNTNLNNGGMIFIFKKAGNYGFWMKDMNFALDILWINDNYEIVGIEKSLSPSTYPNSFGQKYFAKYVLEVSAGYCEKNNIKVGDKLIFNQN